MKSAVRRRNKGNVMVLLWNLVNAQCIVRQDIENHTGPAGPAIGVRAGPARAIFQAPKKLPTILLHVRGPTV
jgi:hypothetical protein